MQRLSGLAYQMAHLGPTKKSARLFTSHCREPSRSAPRFTLTETRMALGMAQRDWPVPFLVARSISIGLSPRDVLVDIIR